MHVHVHVHVHICACGVEARLLGAAGAHRSPRRAACRAVPRRASPGPASPRPTASPYRLLPDTRQIAHLLEAADDNEDGTIDYNEFEKLFTECILELARLDSIDKMLREEEAAGVVAAYTLFLDELMIPLHLAFDIAAEGADACPTASVAQMLMVKGPEWGVPDEASASIAEAAVALGESIEWPQLVEIIERLAAPPADAAEPPP